MDLVTPDFAWLCCAALLAGTVRGFVGFGTALIYLPLAAMVLSPVDAVLTLILMDLVGPVPMLPKALPHIHRKDLMRLVGGTVIALPVGLALLFLLDAGMFRTIVGVISLLMLTGLILGWRYRGKLKPGLIFGIGMSSGFLGGVAGTPGPPVIFIYMASTLPAQVIRANTTAYLLSYDWLMMGMLALSGRVSLDMLIIGAVLTAPNMLGNLIGTKLFDPKREQLFRWIAYALIAAAALSGLPIWGQGPVS